MYTEEEEEDKDGAYLGVFEVCDTDDSLEHDVAFRVAALVDDSGAVDQVYSLCEVDVLPDLGFSRDGRSLADCTPRGGYYNYIHGVGHESCVCV